MNTTDSREKLNRVVDLDNLTQEETQCVIQHALDLMEQEAINEKKNRWRSPFEWTEEEVHELVMNEVGEDTLFPRGYQVLIKLWMPPRELDDGYGLVRTDHMMRNERITTNIGRVLRMGSEAFREQRRFPGGPTVTFGEWVVFRTGERNLIQCGEHFLAHLTDDRFIAMTTDPSNKKTTFDLEYEHVG